MDKVFIWGTGDYAKDAFEAIDKNKCDFRGFIDGNREKQGELWRGEYRIVSPEKALKEEMPDYVLISVLSSAPIVSKAIDMGYKKDCLIRLWEDELVYDFISEIYLLKRENRYLKLCLENAPYEYGALPSPHIIDSITLLKRICKEHISLARFGDGEFEMMRGHYRLWYQHSSDVLTSRLLEVLNSRDDRVAIAIADDFGSLEQFTKKAADGIREYMVAETRKAVTGLLDLNREYYNAYVTRPYFIYKDKTYSERVFSLFKQIFCDRNILLVEGNMARTGIGNDLFRKAKSIRRILCPETESFDYYTEIEKAIRNNYVDGDLVLVSLGPTATVLAYDLGKDGIQTIDIGQIDTEYEWYLMGAVDREEVPGKRVAELSWWHEPEQMDNDIYELQIIWRIGQ